MRQECLYPFKYRCPFPDDVSRHYQSLLQDFGKASPSRGGLLQKTAASVHQGTLDPETWSEFCTHYVAFLAETHDGVPIRQGWQLLTVALARPGDAFRDLVLNQSSAAYFPGVDPRFVEAVDEVLRDGRVTPSEIGYLEEKRRTYKVSEEEYEHVLATKRRFNTSLLRLVDEVCQDLVVTDAEREMLVEKNGEFGVSEGEVLDLVKKFYTLHRDCLTVTGDHPFALAVGALFVAKFLLYDRHLADEAFQLADEWLLLAEESAIARESGRLFSIARKIQRAMGDALGFEVLGCELDLKDLLDFLGSVTSPVEVAASALRSRAVSEMRSALESVAQLGPAASSLTQRLKSAISDAPVSTAPKRNPEGSATWVSDGIRYNFQIAAFDSPAVFRVKRDGASVDITLNQNHDFMSSFASPDTKWASPAVLTLLAAWARYELDQPNGSRVRVVSDTRTDWGRVVRRLLSVDPRFGH